MSDPVAAVRRFNRFYTQRIGVLAPHHLESEFSLTEVRVLYELAHRERPTATEIAEALGLDKSYLSRILRRLTKQRLVERMASPEDGRESLLYLSELGRRSFSSLNARSNRQVAEMMCALSPEQERRVVTAMETIQSALQAPTQTTAPLVLRPHRPGDMGWVVHRHGVLYAQEYGWDERFEALVAHITADFIQHYDERRERCFIAEQDGQILGCVFLVQKSKTVAQLRLLLVEPAARGRGLGHRLVDECVRLARQVGYRKMILWTNDVLHAARRIYQAAGFQLIEEQRHTDWGPELVGQTWELAL